MSQSPGGRLLLLFASAHLSSGPLWMQSPRGDVGGAVEPQRRQQRPPSRLMESVCVCAWLVTAEASGCCCPSAAPEVLLTLSPLLGPTLETAPGSARP